MTSPASPLRYALYFALPQASGLWQAAQSWLGRDCETGAALAQPALDGWSAEEIAAVTKSPRHYGFHATLKAPFELAEGTTAGDLHQAVSRFAAQSAPFAAPPLKVSAIGPFLALTLTTPCPQMQDLAAAAVKDLEPLRAPLGEGDLQRRLQSGLTPRQEELLRAWGYPYVMEEFRFHMTLTGPIAENAARERLQGQLAEHFRPYTTETVPVGEISLYDQDSREVPFRLRTRFRLGENAAVPAGDTNSKGDRIAT